MATMLLTEAEAVVLNNLSPGNQLIGIGTKLKYALDQLGVSDTDGLSIDATVTTGLAIAGTMTSAIGLTGAATTGIRLSGSNTTGIAFAGTHTTGIDFSGASTLQQNIILGGVGRVSTGSAAGSTLNIDATTASYGEGLELRYNVSDWADGATTLTSGKGMYLRMETNEANASGSILGAEIYGVTNNVNIQYLTGAVCYAYVKGTSAKTITGLYALQPEITFDASSANNTITEAAIVRAKLTGGAMANYTTMHGYKLIVGDMDGGSRTYGNAIWVADDGDMAGTCGFTRGLYLNAGCITGIEFAGAISTGIHYNNTGITTGIDFSPATTMIQNIILGGNGRVSTSTAAGATLNIDATNSLYSEGMELRYNLSDWADGATTFTSAKGMYLRMETNEANGAGSVTGMELYGVTNNVDIQYLTGGLCYAYCKGVSAKTLTGMYAFQPELSFDAGSAANTITEACVVRAKVTGGVMAAYTNLHGYKLIVGDMDGGSRVYGNAFWVVDDAAMAGTCSFTTGLNINIGCTNDIQLQSGSTISDANHLDIETLSDTKRIRLNDRNYAATTGDIIGFSCKPAANASGTQTVYGGQISPRANDNVDVAALIGLQVEPILKGATVLAVAGDMRALDVRLTSEGANTVGGIAGGIFLYNQLKSATFTGGVYPIVVKANSDTQPWTGLMEIPSVITNAANGGGAAVYIDITIDGVAARLTAKYMS